SPPRRDVSPAAPPPTTASASASAWTNDRDPLALLFSKTAPTSAVSPDMSTAEPKLTMAERRMVRLRGWPQAQSLIPPAPGSYHSPSGSARQPARRPHHSTAGTPASGGPRMRFVTAILHSAQLALLAAAAACTPLPATPSATSGTAPAAPAAS